MGYLWFDRSPHLLFQSAKLAFWETWKSELRAYVASQSDCKFSSTERSAFEASILSYKSFIWSMTRREILGSGRGRNETRDYKGDEMRNGIPLHAWANSIHVDGDISKFFLAFLRNSSRWNGMDVRFLILLSNTIMFSFLTLLCLISMWNHLIFIR
jgi:hypothetical protein